MDASAAAQVLKDAGLIASKKEFDEKRYNRHFTSKIKTGAVNALMKHFCVDDRNSKRRIESWLNSGRPFCELDTPKRQRMETSFDETDVVDLDATMESVSRESELQAEIERLQKVIEEKDAKLIEKDEEIEALKGNKNAQFFGKGARFNSFQPAMHLVAIKSLSKGITCTHLAHVLKLVAKELGFKETDVPHVNSLNRWREEKLPPLNQFMIDEFVEQASELTICVDDTSMAGSAKLSCILFVNEKLDHCLFDLVPSKARTGVELKEQMLARIHRQPRSDLIIAKLKAIMSDCSSVQLLANRLAIEELGESPLRAGKPKILQLQCGMHTG